jgi:hypothetical protein
MKPSNQFISTLAAICSITLFAGCSKSDGDKPAAAPEKAESPAKAGVTIDAETQARIGLKMETPAALQWLPEVKGHGVVIDPVTLTAAVMDLASARTAADVSTKESARQKILAAQDNVSARALESANAEAQRNVLAMESALVKFKQDWGSALAENSELEKIQTEVVNGTAALVRIDLPAGETLPSLPTSVRIVTLTDEAKTVNGDFCGATDGVNPQTQGRSFFFLVKGQPLPAGAAVTGFMKISGEPVGGVVVPFSAILRHEGKGWAYVQTETNQFLRTEIPLDRLTDNGWFVSEILSATNHVVVTGAQTVLSAELSGGGFNTGTRD